MKKTIRVIVAALLVGILAGPYAYIDCRAAASGNYTDLLPIGAAGNTTVISNGSGWSLTTLAPSQTFGDALSRAPFTAYQSTSAANVTASTTVSTITAISGQGFVGSTTFPATWVASGRSIRITARGQFATINNQDSWTWGVKLGTTTVLVSSTPAPINVTSSGAFTVNGIITIAATGNAGTVLASYDVFATTGAINTANALNVSNVMSFSTATAAAVTVDLTSQVTVNPVFNWGQSSQGNNVTLTNVLVEFLN